MKKLTRSLTASIVKTTLAAILISLTSFSAYAACKDSVVLVHGNTGDPSDWDNTYAELLNNGYYSDEIYTPEWGSKYCPACNNHSGSEEYPVRYDIEAAIASSCTGKIDVIGHSMGVTLAAQQIIKLGVSNKVDTFVGVAGSWRGLLTCGVYPFNVWSSTCGYYGLSVGSPFLNSIKNKTIGSKVYSIKSWVDQIICGTGTCYVYGKHSSRIDGENDTFTYNYGHFGLQMYTSSKQVSLIQ